MSLWGDPNFPLNAYKMYELYDVKTKKSFILQGVFVLYTEILSPSTCIEHTRRRQQEEVGGLGALLKSTWHVDLLR